MALPAAVDRLVHALARLPGVGEKTATRWAFHLLTSEDDRARGLARALTDAAERVGACANCGNLTEASPCPLCADPRRDDAVVCVVEGVQDLLAIERTGEFRGRYHVLGGCLQPLRGVGPDDLNLASLRARLRGGGIGELIAATSVGVEGEATALYLKRIADPLGIRVTRIATGIPMGGELEFVDPVTLSRALSGRREL